MKRLLIALALSLGAPAAALAQQSAVVTQVSARNEVAAALYAASATQAAAERAADARLRAERTRIEAIARRAQAGEAQARVELASAQERYVADLAAKDRAYAQEIAVFRSAVQDIAATPEGTAALAKFNAGDELGALAILDRLRAARDAARQARANIESAAEGRRIAALALEARSRGKLDTAAVIARYVEVTRLDSSLHWDWIVLSRLYIDAGNLSDASIAAVRAEQVAGDARDRTVALDALGNLLREQGNLPGALARFQESLDLLKQLAAADPGSVVLQRDISITLNKMGDVLRAQGNLDGARASFQESLEFIKRIAADDPTSARLQRNYSISLSRIGDVLLDQGDLAGAREQFEQSLDIARRLSGVDPSSDTLRVLSAGLGRMGDVLLNQGDSAGARERYEQSLDISKRLAAADPSSAEHQRDLMVIYVKLQEATGDRAYAQRALDVGRAMQARGQLAPRDAWIIQDLERRIGS